jgi:hypothetical protein
MEGYVFSKSWIFLKPYILGDFILLISNPNGGFETTIRAPYGGLPKPLNPYNIQKSEHSFLKAKVFAHRPIYPINLGQICPFQHISWVSKYIYFFNLDIGYEHDYSNVLEMDIKQMHLMFTCVWGHFELEHE